MVDQKKKKTTGGFQSLGLSPEMFKGVMAMGYKVPTPIQRKALPIVLSGKDVVAMARTGSGKTAAFLVPMVEKLKHHSATVGARAVILSPTRELAVQTLRFAKQMSKFTSLKYALIVGGESMDQQFEAIASNPDVIVATPGRLVHLLLEIPSFSLRTTEYLVFDEADRMFEMGFAEQLQQVMRDMPPSRQTVLFSATLPKALAQFARAGLNEPELIRLDVDNKISENLNMGFFNIKSDDKPAAFLHLVRDILPSDQQTIVFAATRHHVEFLFQLLQVEGIETSCVYGEMDQAARKISVGKFRAGKTRLLLVTDVAARGIDIPLLNNVINYHFPPVPKLFVHRVGRAARAGRSGAAFNFVVPDELPYMVDLFLYLGRRIEDCWDFQEKQYTLTSMSTDDVHFGTFNRPILDAETEHVREVISRHNHISSMIKVCKNALGQYSRTRPDPSKRSIGRAKEIKGNKLHPLFMDQLNEDAISKSKYLDQLEGFRPNQTIFEVATGAHSLKKNSKGVVMMRAKRKVHERHQKLQNMNTTEVESPETTADEAVIERVKVNDTAPVSVEVVKRPISKAERKKMKKRNLNCVQEVRQEEEEEEEERNPVESFQDKENYIGYMKDSERATETFLSESGDAAKNTKFLDAQLEEAILDVNPDEAIKLNNQKRIMHWDARKKKYIKATIGDIRSGAVSRRNESGARVAKAKTGDIYKKWQQKVNKRIATAGDVEEEGQSLDYRRGKRPKIQGKTSNGHRPVRDELKNEGEIRKEEVRKARSRGINPASKKKFSKRGKGNIRGKSHGAPTRSKAIIRRR